MPLPPPRTDAARAALKSFFCELCQKGYARLPEWEAHEASYDHQHKKRLKEMKQMSKDPQSATRARKAERKADLQDGGGLITIKPMKLGAASSSAGPGGTGGVGGGFKKGGFKSAFGGGEPVKVAGDERPPEGAPGESGVAAVESDSEDEGDEKYDPSFPTGCPPDCPGRNV